MLNVGLNLFEPFLSTLNELKEKYGPDFEELNGFAPKQLNYTAFIDGFIDAEVQADTSIDGNANSSSKDITALESEMSKPQSKLLGFNKIFYEITKKYGVERAKQWLEEEWRGSLYLHDAASATYKPYCFAYDTTDLAEKGLFFINSFNGGAPKHLTSYVDFLIEFVSWTSNRSSGACGLPDALIYMYYFWQQDVKNGYYTETPEKYRDQSFQTFVYRLNQPFLRVSQSAFTNISIYDRPYLEALFGGKVFPNGEMAIDHIDEILQFQKDFMNIVSEIRMKNMMTFPVLTYALLFDENTETFVDEETARWAATHNMKWNDSNFFISKDVTSLSNCCRLLSNIDNMGYFNSIGGSALSVGSAKVNTVNFAAAAYGSGKDKNKFFETVQERVTLAAEILDIVRSIITRNIEKGLLPQYNQKIIDITKQYNTIGLIGIYETLKHFGFVKKDEFGNHFYTEEGLQFAEELLELVAKTKDNYLKQNEKNYMINLEQIPAERTAAILKYKDELLYPNGEYDHYIYGNQWIPLAVHSTLQTKIETSARLDKACSGGSVAHLNLEAPLTNEKVAWDLLNYVAKAGVPYFAWNVRIATCKDNHAFFGETCPVCGEPIHTTYQRIVGFLVPEKSYSKERKKEFSMRQWFGKGDLI